MTADLTPYVPRLVLEWEAKAPGVTLRRIEGSLVFVDLSGFTAMSERLAKSGRRGAEEVTDAINSTFTELLSLAYEVGGGLLKFGGDALLIFFSELDHARRACHAVLGMRRKLQLIGRIITSAGAVRLRMSAGVHSGNFHFFLVGDSHKELIVTGPDATRTVEMETTAEANEIIVSTSTASLIRPSSLGEPKGNGVLLKSDPGSPAGDFSAASSSGYTESDRFIPVAVRRHLSGGGADPEHRQINVAFVAFEDTDALIEQHGSDFVAARLDELVRASQEAADRYEICFLSTDISTRGGKIILTAGTPASHENDEERILRALREIVNGASGLKVRIGVNRGHAFCGDVGPFYRRTYTVMGDAVNTAARIMTHAQPSEILVSSEVLTRSPIEFESEELPPFSVKGKAKPLVAHRLGEPIGTRETVTPDVPMLGRDTELVSLMDRIEVARGGHGGVVSLIGDAGMGKTRLTEEVLSLVDGFSVATAQCEQYQESTPYFVLNQLMLSVLGLDLQKASNAVAQDLSRLVRRVAPGLEEWLPLIGIPLGLEIEPTAQTKDLDMETRSHRMRAAVADLILAVHSSEFEDPVAPWLWIVEDAHWLDSSSGVILAEVNRRLTNHGWLLLITRRPGTFPHFEESLERSVRLQELPDWASQALVKEVAAGKLLPQQVESIAERSGGHPLFLLEMVAVASNDWSLDEIPESVETLIAARIDRLSPADRSLLRLAAVMGRISSCELLCAVSGDPRLDSDDTWRRLSEFVERTGDTIRFRQALFQQAAYQGLPYRKRHALHERVGRILEARSDAEKNPDLLSLHFDRAQNFKKSWVYSRRAAKSAQTRFGYSAAAVFYKRAGEAAERLKLSNPKQLTSVWKSLGDVLVLSGRLSEAPSAYKKARSFATDPATQADIFFFEGRVREQLGRLPDALRWARRGLDLLETSTKKGELRIRSRIKHLISTVRLRQGKYSESIAWAKRAFQDAKKAGFTEGVGHAYNNLFLASVDLRMPESTQYGINALNAYEKVGNPRYLGNILSNLGAEAYSNGDWNAAVELYLRGKMELERAGQYISAAVAATNVGEVLSDQGRLAEADSIFRDSLDTLEAAGSQHAIKVRAYLGRGLARAGHIDEAQKLLEESLEGFRLMRTAGTTVETYIAEADVLRGDCHRALESTAALVKRANPGVRPLLLRVRGYALGQSGDTAAAKGAFGESLVAARAVGQEHEAALTLEALGRLARLLGEDPSEAEREAHEIFVKLGITSTPLVPLRRLEP